MTKDDLAMALRCCRAEDCEHCPVQLEICDELRVDMEAVPADLVDLVIDALETKIMI
jgi:hypothetical protein